MPTLQSTPSLRACVAGVAIPLSLCGLGAIEVVRRLPRLNFVKSRNNGNGF
ncbi:MAG: hypothetical protein IJ881_10400 [Neisseriaceae bacterium]|nr:hypothetical protein [Neisseriaceae bacterium]